MSKTIVKFALNGKDVYRAADNELLFSSEWPTLKINNIGTTTKDINSSGDTVVFNHKLGYVPFYMIWEKVGDVLIPGFHLAYYFLVDADNLIFRGGGYGSADNRTIYYAIFRQDLTKSYLAPDNLKNVESIVPTDHGVSIKIAKQGYDIKNSTDPRNFALHSHYKNMLIHKIQHGTETVGAWPDLFDVTIDHNLGYAPMFMFYYKAPLSVYNPNPKWQLLGDSQETKIYVGDNQLRVRAITGFNISADYSVIIFKDPFLI